MREAGSAIASIDQQQSNLCIMALAPLPPRGGGSYLLVLHTVNRDNLKDIARVRLQEARTLLRAQHYDGAYYLCGYVLECAFKACIARRTQRYDFPDKKTVNLSYTHNLDALVRVARLNQDLGRETAADPVFEVNWTVAKDWSEDSRYARLTRRQARDLYSAISDRQHGVLRWLRRHW